MNYLLDTHTFLWDIFDTKKLSREAKEGILNPQNSVFRYSTIPSLQLRSEAELSSLFRVNFGWEFSLINDLENSPPLN